MKSRTVRFFYDDEVLIIEERNAIHDSGGARRREWITERVALRPAEAEMLIDKITGSPIFRQKLRAQMGVLELVPLKERYREGV